MLIRRITVAIRADLHRHLGGSISCSTVARLKKMPLEKVTKLMTYSSGEKYDYDTFFDKFKVMDDIEWTLASIKETIDGVVWQLRSENINYSEIKFSVNKYLPYIDMELEEVILWLAKCFDDTSSKWGIDIDLILSLKHNMDKDKQLEISNSINNDLIAECISGIDIVGNEKFFDVEFYKPIFKRWHDAKKVCMAHVGEINRPDNVINAIELLNLDRVCHGIAVANNKELAKISQDKLIAFDICLTSNICTGVATMANHPINEMIDNGFIVTIGTDDPSILNTDYDKEFDLLKSITNLSDNEVSTIKESAYAFSAREISKRKK